LPPPVMKATFPSTSFIFTFTKLLEIRAGLRSLHRLPFFPERPGSRSLLRSPFSGEEERNIAEHRSSDGSPSAAAICLWMRWSYERDQSSARADSFRRPQ